MPGLDDKSSFGSGWMVVMELRSVLATKKTETLKEVIEKKSHLK